MEVEASPTSWLDYIVQKWSPFPATLFEPGTKSPTDDYVVICGLCGKEALRVSRLLTVLREMRDFGLWYEKLQAHPCRPLLSGIRHPGEDILESYRAVGVNL